MNRQVDETRPGAAGLFQHTNRLTEVGWQQERAARAKLERWCIACGQPARFGYGSTLRAEGVWSCADAECRVAAENEAERIKRTDLAGGDLFGAAA